VSDVTEKPSARAKSNPAGASIGMLPNFEMPKFEVPVALRDFVDKSSSQAREACERMKASTDEMTDQFREAYTTAVKGANDYGLQVIEASQAHANALFDYAAKLMVAKSPTEFLELSNAHVREQFGVLTEHSKKLAALAQKIANESTEPIKQGMANVFRRATER
jgi:phasin